MQSERITLLEQPEALITWLNQQEVVFELSKEEAELLLGYMDGHDYRIGIDENQEMVRIDIGEPDEDVVPYHIHEVVDMACEWNYELLQHTEEKMNDAVTEEQQEKLQMEYEQLQKDEVRLDVIFERTPYAQVINDKAQELADRFIEEYMKKNNINVEPILEEIGRGR